MFFKSHFTAFRQHIFRGSNLSQTQFQNMYFGSVLPGYYLVFHVWNLVNSNLKERVQKLWKVFARLKDCFELRKRSFKLKKNNVLNSEKKSLNKKKSFESTKISSEIWKIFARLKNCFELGKSFELKKKKVLNSEKMFRTKKKKVLNLRK